MTQYDLFPGVYLMYNDFHMEGYDSAFHTTEDMLCIDYCRQGRMEYPAGPDAYSYVEAGDLKLDRRLEHQGHFTFPLSHYHGITFFLEACLLVWLGVALRKKKPKMRKACGIILLVFCALSPFVSWLLEALLYRLPDELALESPLSFIFSFAIFNYPREIIARSCWPLFKMFTMLMYALIAFFPPEQMVALHPNRTKRITIQPSTASSYLEAYKLNRKNGGK